MSNPMHQRRESGHSVVEVALMAPWIFFLFIAIFDFGFYAYALISVENAARVAVMYTSSSVGASGNDAAACLSALPELTSMPNARGLTNCGSVVQVDAQAITGPDGAPASRVTVTYQTVSLIPMMLIPAQFTINRSVEMRVRD